MSPVKLFTAFHANLDFSALPEADRALVISRCYWPLLALPERLGVPIGFEMSARTLGLLADEDPEWLKRFIHLAETHRVEVIGSGWAQIVAPLVPVEVNRSNLERGRVAYRERLGFEPKTYFLNEQTVSEGVMPLYAEIGAERVICEWNNPASRRPELRALRGQPVQFEGAGPEDNRERSPAILWNDSILFQKAQRVAHGSIPANELYSFLGQLLERHPTEALCLYGGDVEIFDYRPSRAVPASKDGLTEMARLLHVFETLAKDPRFEFCLPRDVIEPGRVLPGVRLGSSADPLPCKKQPRYNPTRWMVSGRDAFGMNTRCYSALKSQRAVSALSSTSANASSNHQDFDSVVDLWRSDFRTRATEEKIETFETGMGRTREAVRHALDASLPEIAKPEELLIVNPWSSAWRGMPVEIPFRLPVGQCESVSVKGEHASLAHPGSVQIDVVGRHRDGSIRDARLLIEPHLAAKETLRVVLEAVSSQTVAQSDQERVQNARTDQVAADFLCHRGATLDALRFPEIAPQPLLGTIGHGTFDEIEYTPDFYSGHVVAVSEDGTKTADLQDVDLRILREESGPVRLTLAASLKTRFGNWNKIIRLYRNRPRLEWLHDLRFDEARLASLRLGHFTLLPRAWDPSTLRYGAVNGGQAPEWYALDEATRVSQSSAVSSSVTASSCLGATQGWVAFEDAEKGVLIEGDRARAAVAPMLDFRSVDDAFFCRLSHSLAETDETRATFLRGQRRIGFGIEGYGAGASEVFEDAELRHRGLAYRTENGFGLTSSL